MGYYISMTGSHLVIPQRNYDVALEALHRLNWRNDLKGGGCWPRTEQDGPNPSIWFSWMDWNYHERYTSLARLLEVIGFDIAETASEIVIYGFDDKAGDEDVFLEALAPFYDRTMLPYVEWLGEDNEGWRIEFHLDHIEMSFRVDAWTDGALHSYRVN